MRWSITLESPTIVAPVAGEGSGHRLELGPDPAGRTVTLLIRRGPDCLFVGAEAAGLADPGARPDHDEWENRAYLCVLLNPSHDHAVRWRYAVDDRGRVYREAHLSIQGEEFSDLAAVPLDAPPEAEGVFRYGDSRSFTASLRIPSADLFTRSETPVGLAVNVGFHEIPIPHPLAWPSPLSWTKETPLIFADLYADPPPLAVTSVDLIEPFWGGRPNTLRLRLWRSANSPASGKVKIRTVLPGDSEHDQPNTPWSLEESIGAIDVPIVFPFRAKWANGMPNVARLLLAICDDSDRSLWQAEYPFSIDFGIIVRERYGQRAGKPAGRPKPSSPDFLDAFRAYILTRLPDYQMCTTRDGAPSDFFLEDPENDAPLDLSAEDALERGAAMIASRFPDWQEALCGAAMWVHHPHVTRHSSSWSRVANAAPVDTIPRLGGCFCGDTSRLTAALSELVGAELGVPLVGYSMGLRGHLATLVDTPIGRIVIDGMLGLWFHTLDNTRLATLEEMRSSRQITERVWYAPRAHGHEFFYGHDTQLIRPWSSGPLCWPEGWG